MESSELVQRARRRRLWTEKAPCAAGAVLQDVVRFLLPLRIPMDPEFELANQVLFPFVAAMRLTITRNSTMNARRIATHHTASKIPRTPIRKATRRSREDGASQRILTRSVTTRMGTSLAVVDLNRLPEKLFHRARAACPLYCLRGPIAWVAAFGHLPTYGLDVSVSTRPPVREQIS